MDAAESVYQAPQSELATSETPQQPKFLALSGRIGRLRYLAYSFGLFLLLIPILAIVSLTLVPFPEDGATATPLFTLTTTVLAIGYVIMSLFMMRRRLNDCNLTGWLCLLNFIPLINIIFFMVLVFMPGSKGTNKYGAMPTKNSALLLVSGLIFPAIAIIGFVAAVAIPAYQQYLSQAGV